MINYRKLFYWRCKGLNNKQIAEKLGVHYVTIQRHFLKFKELSDDEFKVLFKDVFEV